jgi:hypothetical protein
MVRSNILILFVCMALGCSERRGAERLRDRGQLAEQDLELPLPRAPLLFAAHHAAHWLAPALVPELVVVLSGTPGRGSCAQSVA